MVRPRQSGGRGGGLMAQNFGIVFRNRRGSRRGRRGGRTNAWAGLTRRSRRPSITLFHNNSYFTDERMSPAVHVTPYSRLNTSQSRRILLMTQMRAARRGRRFNNNTRRNQNNVFSSFSDAMYGGAAMSGRGWRGGRRSRGGQGGSFSAFRGGRRRRGTNRRRDENELNRELDQYMGDEASAARMNQQLDTYFARYTSDDVTVVSTSPTTSVAQIAK